MREPAVLRCPVPVLDFGGDIHHITGLQPLRRFSFFLIPALSGNAEQYLISAVMDMPEVPASRFERDIQRTEIFVPCKHTKIALSGKVFPIGIWLSNFEGSTIAEIGSHFIFIGHFHFLHRVPAADYKGTASHRSWCECRRPLHSSTC